MAEEKLTQEEEVKLAKIKLGSELTTSFEVDYKDPGSDDTIHLELVLHAQTIKDDLKITVKQDKLLEGQTSDTLMLATRMIALLDVLTDKIILTIDGEKHTYTGGFWELVQKFDLTQAYQEIILPTFFAYQKFSSENKMDFAKLKKSLIGEKNK